MEQANRLSGEDMDGAAVRWMGAGHWTTVDFISAGATYSRHSKVRNTLSAILITLLTYLSIALAALYEMQ
jgi:hypothetical protein